MKSEASILLIGHAFKKYVYLIYLINQFLSSVKFVKFFLLMADTPKFKNEIKGRKGMKGRKEKVNKREKREREQKGRTKGQKGNGTEGRKGQRKK